MQTICEKSRDEEIARRAYALWEQGGRLNGHDLDYWLQAEQEFAAAGQACCEVDGPSESTKLELASRSPKEIVHVAAPQRNRKIGANRAAAQTQKSRVRA